MRKAPGGELPVPFPVHLEVAATWACAEAALLDHYGFPQGYLMKTKRVQGIGTGDLMKAKPGEIRIAGRKPRGKETGPQVELHVGAGVSPEAVAFLRLQFLGARYNIVSHLNPDLPPDQPFVVELAARGYDLDTFRISVFTAAAAPPPTRIRLMQQRKGVLHCRWSWVEYDHSPDLVCCWSIPCSRRDSNLLLGLFSMPGYSSPYESRHGGLSRSFESEFKKTGLAVRTFKFLVKHSLRNVQPE